jgi:hypothetical protein
MVEQRLEEETSRKSEINLVQCYFVQQGCHLNGIRGENSQPNSRTSCHDSVGKVQIPLNDKAGGTYSNR